MPHRSVIQNQSLRHQYFPSRAGGPLYIQYLVAFYLDQVNQASLKKAQPLWLEERNKIHHSDTLPDNFWPCSQNSFLLSQQLF